jgi:hypothetical protein
MPLDISGRALWARAGVLLRFDHDTLEFLENRELFVRRINFGISLLLAGQKTDLFKPLQFALDIARVFFN